MYSTQQLPDSYLNHLIRSKNPVFIYLRNGGRLTGIIIDHSQDTLFLREGITGMVSKNLVNMITRQSTK